MVTVHYRNSFLLYDTCISDCCILLTLYSGSGLCPADNTVLLMEQIHPDKFCDREIMKLEVRCSNKHRGCEWTGPFQFLEVRTNFYFHVIVAINFMYSCKCTSAIFFVMVMVCD